MSNSAELTTWWNSVHTAAFRNVARIVPVVDLNEQLSGIDRLIVTGDRTIAVEEKTDYTQYKNIAFEVESTQGYSAGWARKPIAADVFAYGFKEQNVVYYFSTADLLGAFSRNHLDWKRRFGERSVWGSSAVVLPVPVEVVTQAVTKFKKIHL